MVVWEVGYVVFNVSPPIRRYRFGHASCHGACSCWVRQLSVELELRFFFRLLEELSVEVLEELELWVCPQAVSATGARAAIPAARARKLRRPIDALKLLCCVVLFMKLPPVEQIWFNHCSLKEFLLHC